MPANRKRHVVTVLRPTEAQSDGGQQLGEQVVMRNVPCSLEHLSGREAEKARAIYAEATVKVEMYGNPQKPLRHTDWLELPGLDGAKRKLHIGDINDAMQNGVKLTLLCAEEPR